MVGEKWGEQWGGDGEEGDEEMRDREMGRRAMGRGDERVKAGEDEGARGGWQ